MVRKCSRGIAEIAVMEAAQVGVRTRARAALDETSSGTAKRRKVSAGELVELSSPCDAQLRGQSRTATASDNSVLPTTSSPESNVIGGRQDEDEEEEEEEEGECLSPSSDHAQVSCCSSNASSELAEDRIKFVDLEDESAAAETSTYNSCRERREMTPSSELRGAESDNAESTARTNVSSNSRRRPAGAKMPSELELEEFFSATEKDIQKKFAAKYNYDIAKDAPLEGRYEWIRLKP